jgi:lipoprotein-anchoring transpeptidase ErfK/SrfK
MKYFSAALAFSLFATLAVSDDAVAREKKVEKRPSLLERIFKPNKKTTKKKRKKNGIYIYYGDENKRRVKPAKKVAYKKAKKIPTPTRDVMRYVKSPVAKHIEARVDLSEQRMSVYRGGRKLYTWKVSTGRKGYNTPRGSYKPYRMHNMWYSTKYEYTPMPHAIFFKGGFAIHATNSVRRLGSRASHGCVRLSPQNAATLFQLVRKNGANNTSIKIIQ